MEETITSEQQLPEGNSPGLLLTPQAEHYLKEAAGWARFLGIMGFIGSGILAFFGFFAGAFFNYLQSISPNPTPNPFGAFGPFIGFVYVLIALLCFFPALFLYRFGVRGKKAVLYGDEHDTTGAIESLKSFLKFWGIYLIIYLGFIALFLVGAIIIGMFAATRH